MSFQRSIFLAKLLKLNYRSYSNRPYRSIKLTRSIEDLKPFSNLFISEKYKSVCYKVVEPDLKLESYLDDEYLDRLKKVINQRDIDELKNINWLKIKDDVKELIERRSRLKENLKHENFEAIEKENVDLFKLEDRLIPTLLRLPNMFDEDEVPLNDDKILKETRTKFHKFKLLDCKRISYLNNIRKSSIIGPHCEYLLGKGALINLALQKYFRNSIKASFPEPEPRKDLVHRHLHEGKLVNKKTCIF